MLVKELRLLYRLCRLYGVEPAYRDVEGKLRAAGPETLLAVLRALGAPVAGLADVPGALRERRLQYWRRFCEPVAVAWSGRLPHLELRLPVQRATGPLECRLRLEDGRLWQLVIDPARLPLIRVTEVEGVAFEARQLTLPARLPWGYHHLHLRLPGLTREVLIIAAPSRAWYRAAGQGEHLWGCFLPLYALHSCRSLGAGDFGDLEALSIWVNKLGGNFTATLPFLAAFLDEPFDPSPYQPVSRLFWNEFYLDISRLEEAQQCQEVRDLLNSAAVQEEIASLRAVPLVDYRRGMALKRRLLALCARIFFTGNTGGRAEMEAWLAGNPAARDYARFRAAVEKQHATWTEWPSRMREGCLKEGDYDTEAMQYHLYVQWQAHRQVKALAACARRSGPGLYLDLPLGVHREGYDVWRHRQDFALAASSGAPPDTFFRQGQEWGFPPLHPEGIREDGYSYYIACLRHHLRHAGILRLDHVMGLHRLYWIPRGLAATEGVYVRYHAGEFYAILALESRRHRAILVGEDLGTVPGYVRLAMTRHNINRMYVLAAEYTGNPGRALGPVPPGSLASLNTHDMPPFAAFWRERQKSGRQRAALPVFLYNRGFLQVATTATGSLLRGCLAYLAASPARLLLVNLEDLWLETEPQNIPGTGTGYPNWRRKARYSLEEFTRQPEVVSLLRDVNYWRGAAE
ncbi:Glycoside hydrolase, superfamily [Moorella glycerini]|uniref:4-alpha-glucanotransferase n=1 Tax=Neomoorella stamsii TaxID=1266720 RepID=A0A9X7J0R8_9FIRM|nr:MULTISPECIES: 4-alpha-glucanotransferase [Moorella]PRR70343.1 4-alpha-glucanotransferase [Moorella stamsii]CEP66205.1 Glycoside hydrolase, superfamily [Moorella glycerini]CEP66348.1 Glycoside hydrolase, superfamily [Moorella glycerini]